MRFEDFARAHGVIVRDLFVSDRIRRCATVEHERSKNGAYFWDGRRGWVMAWDGDGQVHWFNDETAAPWTDAEKQELAAKRRAASQAKERGYADASRKAQELMRSCRPDEHGYLIRKGHRAAKGLVHTDGALVVPMRDAQSNAVHGAQVIHWDADAMEWVKKFIYGMRAKNAVFRIGPQRAPLSVLCEGYATGLSIAEALRQMHMAAAVVVCFSAHNLTHVAPSLSGRVIAFADNDASGAGEAAAKQAAVPYCMSPLVGEDANDLHQRAGLMAVCGLIQGAARYVTGSPAMPP